MSWISIDPNSGVNVGNTVLDATAAIENSLGRLRAVGGSGGLGAMAGVLQAETDAAANAISRHEASWLEQALDMAKRFTRILEDQLASATIGTVPSAFGAIVGATVVGGMAGQQFGSVSIPGVTGPAIVGGSSAPPAGVSAVNSSGSLRFAGYDDSGTTPIYVDVVAEQLNAMGSNSAAGGLPGARGSQNQLALDIVMGGMARNQWASIQNSISASNALQNMPSGASINGSGPTYATFGDVSINASS
jgi:hypothetical protein